MTIPIRRRPPVLLCLILILATSCAVTPYKEEFKEAMARDDLATAYRVLSEACGEAPGGPFCNRLDGVRERYAHARLSGLEAALEGLAEPVPLPRLRALSTDAFGVGELGLAGDSERILALLSGYEARTRKAVEEAASASVGAERAGRWQEAFTLRMRAASLDPSLGPVLAAFREKASALRYKDGVRAAEAGDWQAAHAAFEDAYAIGPGYRDTGERLEEARAKDTSGYHLEEAGRAEGAGDLERAIELTEKALGYGDAPWAAALLEARRGRAVEEVFARGVRYLGMDRPLAASLEFIEARRMLDETAVVVPTPSSEIGRLMDELWARGASAVDAGRAAEAYAYMSALRKLAPKYPGAAEMETDLADAILSWSLKSLAVVPFKGPSYNVDAGGAVTSGVVDFLYRELSRDVRILERGSIESLLQESIVNTMAGGGADAGGVLKLSGADFLLLGDVVNHRVETEVSETYKTVRAQTGVKKAANPAHRRWLKERSGDEPPEFIEEPVREDIRRKITHHRKTALVTVSYRLVDSRGFVVHTEVAEKRVEAEDEASEGVEIGEFRVPVKVAKLPADGEMLAEARADVVAGVNAGLYRIFSGREGALMKEAKMAAKSGDYREALKKAVEALFVARDKGLDTGDIEKGIGGIIREGGM